MKLIRIFNRNISAAFKSIFRNFSLSSASVICTTITLVIVAISLVVAENINNFTKNLTDTMTMVVFVDSKATNEEIKRIEDDISKIPSVRKDEIIYKTKKDLKEETLENSEKGSTIYTIVSSWDDNENPLEPEFIVSVKEVKQLKETAEKIEKMDKITNVKYSETVLDKMIPLVGIVKKGTICIIVGLIIVTVFLIANTIKLTIYSRKEEIEIMRLVGTSNTIIRLPFVIEGFFLGIIGSIIPIVATIWGYIIIYDKLEGHFFSNAIKMIEPMPFTLYASLVLVGIGAIVGMFGSYTAVRRYLKV